LTIIGKRFIYKFVRRKILLIFFLVLALAFASHKKLPSKGLSHSKNSLTEPQNAPVKKPKYDYMSTFLSRNTNPLGLREDPSLKKLLKQPNIKWAMRAGKKHLLN